MNGCWQFLNKSDIEREPYSKSLVRMLKKLTPTFRASRDKAGTTGKQPALARDGQSSENALRPISVTSLDRMITSTAETEIRKFTEQQLP